MGSGVSVHCRLHQRGESKSEALLNIREAIQAGLEVHAKRGLPLTVDEFVNAVKRCETVRMRGTRSWVQRPCENADVDSSFKGACVKNA